jgi:hypothetical protein
LTTDDDGVTFGAPSVWDEISDAEFARLLEEGTVPSVEDDDEEVEEDDFIVGADPGDEDDYDDDELHWLVKLAQDAEGYSFDK